MGDSEIYYRIFGIVWCCGSNITIYRRTYELSIVCLENTHHIIPTFPVKNCPLYTLVTVLYCPQMSLSYSIATGLLANSYTFGNSRSYPCKLSYASRTESFPLCPFRTLTHPRKSHGDLLKPLLFFTLSIYFKAYHLHLWHCHCSVSVLMSGSCELSNRTQMSTW